MVDLNAQFEIALACPRGRPPPPRHRFIRHGRVRLRPESNPLFSAVLSNDLNQLKSLVESGSSVNTKNMDGTTLLNFVMKHNRIDMFDYLLSLDDTDVDCVDDTQRTPLMYVASISLNEYYALELIKRGADIHLADDSGYTFLHMAAMSNSNLTAGRLVIENGADLDAQTLSGITPLYCACEEGNYEWVYMLLYYGADVMIPSDRGILPLAVLLPLIPNYDQQIQEILFNYTFDGDKITVHLPTLVTAMTSESLLFPAIMEHVADVTYDTSDLDYLHSYLIHSKPQYFRLFVNRCGNIVKEIIDSFPVLSMLLENSWNCEIPELKEIFDIFLESDYVSDFVQKSDPSFSTIATFIEVFDTTDENIEEEEIVEIVCIMLTHGLTVTSVDLDTVYNYYGYCELFKILLHMDINVVDGNNESAFARLCYNIDTNLEDLLNNSLSCSCLLDFFNHPKLKEISVRNSENNEAVAKIKELSGVPLLVELSRNAARKFILSRYRIKNPMQFYTVLKWLPIGEMNKSIIALERKLY